MLLQFDALYCELQPPCEHVPADSRCRGSRIPHIGTAMFMQHSTRMKVSYQSAGPLDTILVPPPRQVTMPSVTLQSVCASLVSARQLQDYSVLDLRVTACACCS